MIRRCTDSDFEAVWSIIDDGARAYKGSIPADCWSEPYMPREELRQELDHGVVFWGAEESGALVGVMGLQDVKDVTLVRHAYVRTALQGRGIGAKLLAHLRTEAKRPILIGTWADAGWAIHFYERHGFRCVGPQDQDALLRRYWTVSDRQIATSVVLAERAWESAPSVL